MSPDHEQTLKKLGLDHPDIIWGYEADWYEPPNHKRGGWSGVNYVSQAGQGYYLKRQENYQRRSLRHPFVGEPTYVREYEMLQYLRGKGVQTPELVLFAKNARQSIMITAELKGFIAADQWFLQHATEDKAPVLKALAAAVRGLHRAGVEHRALFLKHLFVKQAPAGFEVAMIDFEKARRVPWMKLRWLNDIKRCLQRATTLTPEDKAFFLKAYWQTEQLNWWQRKLSHWLINARKEN